MAKYLPHFLFALLSTLSQVYGGNLIVGYCALRFSTDTDACMEYLTDYCATKAVRRTTLCKQFFKIQEKIPAKVSGPGPLSLIPAPPRSSQVLLSDSNFVTEDDEDRPTKAGPVMLKQLTSKLNDAVGEHVSLLKGFFEIAQRFTGGPMGDPPLTELSVNAPLADNFLFGDVDVTVTQFYDILNFVDSLSSLGKRKKRKVAQPPNFQLWHDFPISYMFASSVTSATQTKIRTAIKLWESNTCIRFQENGPKTDRIRFENGAGCSSYVGKVGGTQPISIHQPGCDYIGIISHEIGHCLGFFHEQNRPDQENNVKINYANINPLRYNNFYKQSSNDVALLDIPYDFGSVMHYDGRVSGFSINPFDFAIVAKDPNYQSTMGQRNGPSFVDFKAINIAYCRTKCGANLNCQHEGYTDPNDCSRCKCPDGLSGRLCESVAPSTAGCGGVLQATKAGDYISSPNYPGNFPTGASCHWLIKTRPGFKVYLRFEGIFNFECDEVCSKSYVEVKRSLFQRTGYRFCCSTPPADWFESTGDEMVVILTGNGKVAKGFRAKYRTDAPDIAGQKVTAQTAPTIPPTVATRPNQRQTTTTNKPIPNTFAPAGGQCKCENWSGWSQCDDSCGGCGYKSRTRNCESVTEECFDKEKERCNMQVCKNVADGFTFRNQKLQWFTKGCCTGLFLDEASQNCVGLINSLGAKLNSIVGGIFSFGNRK